MNKRLVLIDGNAILHRAYHALPPLTNKKGELTNAVYGFSSMLLKVISDLKPSYLAVTFDRPTPTFRKKLYKEYQAKRPKMEEDLSSQVDKVHKLVASLGIPIYEMDGYEADDVIGTLAWQATQDTKMSREKEIKRKEEKYPNIEVVIVTGDRDILQLVDENTKVYMPVKGLSKTKLYGIDEVREKFGLEPSQIADFKALTGDPSDNYPGVSGIGPKTAAFLLQNYRSLKGIYESIRQNKFTVKIPDKAYSALVEGNEQAQLCQKLATIVKDVDIAFDPEKVKWHADKEKIKQVFLDLGFESLAKRVEGNKDKPKKKEEKKKEDNQLGLF